MPKTNIDKAINYLQLYRMEHEIEHLISAKRMVDQEFLDRKKAHERQLSGANK